MDQTSTPPAPERGVFLWRFGDWEFDERSWALKFNGEAVEIEPRPLDVLAHLLEHAGETVTKDELLTAAWPGLVVVEAALTNAITKLRKVLRDEEQRLIVTQHRVGYRLAATVARTLVSRGTQPQLQLKAGESVPRREAWQLLKPLSVSGRSQVWLAAQRKTGEQRVFKFAADGGQLSALKREVTLNRLLRESLGERRDFVRVLEWNFDAAPYFIECEYGGPDWVQWAQSVGGLAAVPPAQRLARFIEACEAVAAAHSVGVLHKDLKPANLLMGAREDGSLCARVTDFGSGRLTEPGRLEELGITRLGFTQTQALGADSNSGTLLYLAPELIGGHSASLQSDVYALGVLLYQLAAGDLGKPMAPGWERDVSDALLREDIAAAAHGDPAQRIASVAVLVQRLRTLEQRRATAQQTEATQARLQAAEQALRRARARRPWMAGLAASLLLGLGASLMLYQQAEAARQMAQRQSALAVAANRFLNEDLLALANPQIGGKADVSIREAARLAAKSVDSRFAGEPEIAAALYLNLGQIESQLTEHADAARHYAQAAALLAQTQGADARGVWLARAREVAALANASQLPQALAAFKTLEAGSRAHAQDAELSARIEYARGLIALREARFADAAVALRAARDGLIGLPGADTLEITGIEQGISTTLARSGQMDAALQTAEALVTRLTAEKGAKHPSTLYARHSLATALLFMKQPERAAEVAQANHADALEVLGPEHENTLHILHRLGQIQYTLERWAPAYEAMKTVHAAFAARLGPRNANTLDALNSLADTATHLNRSEEAVTLFRQGLADAQTALTVQHPLTQIIGINLAHALLNLKRAAEAAPLLETAKTQAAGLKPVVPDIEGRLAYEHGRLAALQGESAAAREHFNTALEQLAPHQNPDSWLMKDVREAMSRL